MENLKIVVILLLLIVLLMYISTPRARVKIRKGIFWVCGVLFIGVGIAWICAPFGIWEASFNLSLFGVGVAVFALGLQFWGKAKSLNVRT